MHETDNATLHGVPVPDSMAMDEMACHVAIAATHPNMALPDSDLAILQAYDLANPHRHGWAFDQLFDVLEVYMRHTPEEVSGDDPLLIARRIVRQFMQFDHRSEHKAPYNCSNQELVRLFYLTSKLHYAVLHELRQRGDSGLRDIAGRE